MKTRTLLKWFISIVALIASAALVFGLAAPALISSTSDAGVIAGMALIVVYLSGLLAILNTFINRNKEAK